LLRVGRSMVYRGLQRVRFRNASTLAVSFQQAEVRTR
jgi:hypothetical protein